MDAECYFESLTMISLFFSCSCSGPNNNIGEGACVKCHFVKLDRDGGVVSINLLKGET